MKACNEKLKSSLMEAMKLDNAKKDEELQREQPHQFSADFEKKMEDLMRVDNRKKGSRGNIHYGFAAAMALFLVGGTLFISSSGLGASKIGVDILEWLDEFFVIEDGSLGVKDEDVLFEEGQIGYMTEGFEKAGEVINFANVFHKYADASGGYIIISVYRDKVAIAVDVEEKGEAVQLNAAGYEYAQVYDTVKKENVVMWSDSQGLYYYVAGSAPIEELIKVMNGISY